MSAHGSRGMRALGHEIRWVRWAGLTLALGCLGVGLETADAAGRARHFQAPWRWPDGGVVNPVLADPLDALLAIWISDGEEHGGGAVHAPLPDGSWYEEAVILPPSSGGGGASSPYRRAGALNPYSK